MNKLKNLLLVSLFSISLFSVTSCNNKPSEKEVLKFSFPDGTPVLSIAHLKEEKPSIGNYTFDYNLVSASLIASEIANKSSDLVIMPLNAGANLIRQGADYRLASVSVDGSLFLIGKDQVSSLADLKGKEIACIGQQGIPGLITRYILGQNNIPIASEKSALTSENVFIQYVADGPAARTLLANDSISYALVGEPAATAISSALTAKEISIRLNMQTEYKNIVNDETTTTYPQAGLFIKKELTENTSFMNELYDGLAKSKEWVLANPSEVTEYVKTNLNSSSTFPAASLPNCAINSTKIDETEKQRVLSFLSRLMPSVSGTAINWNEVSLFI